eukprot:g7245.t1
MHLGFPLAGGQALIPSMAKAGTAENSWPYALRVPLPTSYGADEGGSGGPLDFDPSDKPPLPILPEEEDASSPVNIDKDQNLRGSSTDTSDVDPPPEPQKPTVHLAPSSTILNSIHDGDSSSKEDTGSGSESGGESSAQVSDDVDSSTSDSEEGSPSTSISDEEATKSSNSDEETSASTPTEESESSSSSGTPPTPVTESSLEDER